MNYKLELHTQHPSSNVVFNNIIFDTFKINIVERYTGPLRSKPTLLSAIFKLRTLDDILIKRNDGSLKVKLKRENFQTYQELTYSLNSNMYKNKWKNRNELESAYVNFILNTAVSKY